jgi:hypothetical protein
MPLPECPVELRARLAAAEQALAAAEERLCPGSPAAVVEYLSAFADRRGLPEPSGLAAQLDIEIMSGWPADLFARAARLIWEHFAYRRVPTAADFRIHISTDMEDRQLKVAALRNYCLALGRQIEQVGRSSPGPERTPRPQRTPEEIAEVTRLCNEMRRRLS